MNGGESYFILLTSFLGQYILICRPKNWHFCTALTILHVGLFCERPSRAVHDHPQVNVENEDGMTAMRQKNVYHLVKNNKVIYIRISRT